MSITEEFMMDMNLATFILDGEPWGREPASLMRVRSELLTAYRHSGREGQSEDIADNCSETVANM